MELFNKNKRQVTSPTDAQMQMADTILKGFNEVYTKHEKEIRLALPSGVDKVNFGMLMLTIMLDAHCKKVEKAGVESKEKHLKSLYDGLLITWKTNGKLQ